LLLRDWPDNLRGVDRLVHALAGGDGATAGEPLTFDRLPAWLWEPSSPSSSSSSPPSSAPAAPIPARQAPTRDELAQALERHQGSVRATARYYGRDRRQIYRWMESFGLKEK
jgi:transcriptional regulator with GAF, ATPase, and Fis domain